MENLPFTKMSFAVCVVSGALHYANLETTLREVWDVLEPKGQFIITDSPVYTRVEAGQAMISEQRTRLKTVFGLEPYWPGGAGFLVETTLVAEMHQLGFEVGIYSTQRYLGRLKRALIRPLKSTRREEASFPLVIARKPA